MSESITIEELMAELAAVRETLEAERRESFGQWQRDDRIIHELRGQVERLRQKTEAVELVPAPKGMCSSFYEFIGAGAPRSESGEILMRSVRRDVSKAVEQLKGFQREAADLSRRLKAFEKESGLPVDVEFEEFRAIDQAEDLVRVAGEELGGLIAELEEFQANS